MSGWRVWLAFESRPGVTIDSTRDLSGHWRALADACRDLGGRIDAAEFDGWVTCLLDNSHLWGIA